MSARLASPARTITVALVGNPNTGKTTLFNALSGLNQKVGNYPGVTVEKKEGSFRIGDTLIRLIDLPGTYSLAARSPDELVTVDLLLGQQPGETKPDLILNIVDASNLERHTFLTTQLMELGIPVIVAANMMDMARSQGKTINIGACVQALGVPVISIEAHRKIGFEALKQALVQTLNLQSSPVIFPAAFQQEAQQLSNKLGKAVPPALVARLLIDRDGAIEQRLVANTPSLAEDLRCARQRLDEAKCSVPQIEARTRYGFLRQALQSVTQQTGSAPKDHSARFDRIITHRIWGLLIFLGILFVIFQSIFIGAEPAKELLDQGIKTLGEWSSSWLSTGPLKSLIQDGIFAGVGGVITFLPQILILFFFLCILEDCGYMARAAFLMDKIMSKCGLSGKSFIPLLSSFACAIPGIMATRVIEDRRDRLATMIVAPLMSCSARLPVYALLIAAFVPLNTALGKVLPGVVLFGLYLLGIIVAPLVAWFFKRTLLRGETPLFLMELPPYRWPSLWSVLHRMLERAWAFVRRAGTFILASMILVWALLYFPRTSANGERYDLQLEALSEKKDEAEKAKKEADVEKIEQQMKHLQGEWKRGSYLGRLGHAMAPVFKPLGWDWRIGTAALASFPAREVMVGVLGILFDVGEVDDEKTETLGKQLQETTWEGEPQRKLFNLATALSIMVFFALCCQCASTLAVIARESNGWTWPLITFVYMTVLAYVAAFVTYQVASWLGGAA
jgi:ferrous iron transport protein B